MVTIKSIVTDHPGCKGRMVPSRRHGPGDTVTLVSCCFTCGLESPALYDRSKYMRNGAPYHHEAVCEWCERVFNNSLATIKQRFCSISCATHNELASGRFGAKRRSA